MDTFTLTQSTPNQEIAYLYPNADSACTAWTAVGDNPNYVCVDDKEYAPDYLTTYVYTKSSTYEVDLYEFDNYTILGTIDYVKVNAFASSQYPPTPNFDFKFVVSAEDEIYYDDEDLTDGWEEEEDGHVGAITATSSEVVWNQLYFGDSMWFAKDYGTNYFGEFSHCFTWVQDGVDDDPYVVWGVNKDLYTGGSSVATMGNYGDWNQYSGWECLKLNFTTWTLESRDSPNTNTDSWNSGGGISPFYINIVRDATKLHAYFYSDATMTTLEHHLEVVDLVTGTNFRYAYLGCSPNSASVQNVPFTIRNFNTRCDKNCDNIHESSSKDITAGWRKLSHLWTENPVTSAAWVGDDISNIVAGYKGKSALVDDSVSLVLRPNAAGDHTALTRGGTFNYGANYKQVYEEVADDNDSYVYEPLGDPTSNYDLYNMENDTGNVLAGATINYITVFGVFRFTGGTQMPSPLFYVKSGVTTDSKSGRPVSTSWGLQSKSWSTNPDTSVAWTQADINSLQAGEGLENFASYYGMMTQLYVVVNYTPAANEPELRVTQCYLKIADTPGARECTLNKPETISTNHNRNIKMFNFWNGSREVYDLNRSGKSIVLKGMEFEQGGVCDINCPCERITCVRDMAKNGAVVTLAGLGFAAFNGDYRITQFGWNEISEKPQVYEWILQLQDSDL